MRFASCRLSSSRAAAIGLALALALSAASLVAPPAGTVHAHDGAGDVSHTSRLVAIGSSVTEIIYALGLENRLVARDSTSLFPQAALSLPDVGYMRQLSPEGVLSVGPDAIVAVEGSGPPETIDVLKKAGVPLVTIPESFDRAGILEKISWVGAALGETARAGELAAKVDAELLAAEKATSDIEERKRVLFVLSMQGGKILASGQGTAADGMIRLAGGINAVSGFDGYKQLADEAVIEARPDLVLMMDRGGGPGVAEADLLASAALAATPAGQAKNLVRMDGLYLLGFGPRTASAVRDLSAALYGDEAK
ncbi:MAG: ABC transporter substrate-binding protein [Pseudaminobacter sp.]|nr:ABC transporter substrate-binding protein [Pseudaminobacter sp.]